MRRRKLHLSVLNRIVRDERLAPRYVLAAQILAMHEDSETEAEKTFHEEAFFTIFGENKKLKWTAPDDPPNTETFLGRPEAEAKASVKEYLEKTIGTQGGA